VKYSSLHITNFRSIVELKIDNFKRINLITGRNNCGKTTVLEALFQISGMSNPNLPVTVNNIRDLVLTSDDNLRFIFHNLDFKQKPYISAILDGNKRDLVIKPKYASQYNKTLVNDNKINVFNDNVIATSNNEFSVVNGLSLEFNDERYNKKFISEISLSGGAVKIDAQYRENLKCSFHAPQFYMSMFPQRIEQLLVNKQMDGVISSLNEIDKSITDIRIGTAGILYVDIGLNKLLPLNIMGDGIRRILSILAAVSDMRGGILLIDEIETGLHYSSLETLWKSLLRASDLYDVQLFITTHSTECIRALSAILEKDSDAIYLYRIERNENTHRAFEYPSDMVAACVEDNIEMR